MSEKRRSRVQPIWIVRKHREFGWFGWLAYLLFFISLAGLTTWAVVTGWRQGWDAVLAETLPTWLGGVGGTGALVAIYETNKKTRQVATTVEGLEAQQDGPVRVPAPVGSGATQEPSVPQSPRTTWALTEVGKNRRDIVNIGSATAEAVTIRDVTNAEGRSGFYLLDDALPHDVPSGDAIAAGIARTLADPYVSRILITWQESGHEFEATYSVH